MSDPAQEKQAAAAPSSRVTALAFEAAAEIWIREHVAASGLGDKIGELRKLLPHLREEFSRMLGLATEEPAKESAPKNPA